jgi:hypothetical protein
MKTFTTRHGWIRPYWTAGIDGLAGETECAHKHSSEWDANMCANTLGLDYRLVHFGEV